MTAAPRYKEFDDCPGKYDPDCGGKLRLHPGDPRYPEIFPSYLECDECQWMSNDPFPPLKTSKKEATNEH